MKARRVRRGRWRRARDTLLPSPIPRWDGGPTLSLPHHASSLAPHLKEKLVPQFSALLTSVYTYVTYAAARILVFLFKRLSSSPSRRGGHTNNGLFSPYLRTERVFRGLRWTPAIIQLRSSSPQPVILPRLFLLKVLSACRHRYRYCRLAAFHNTCVYLLCSPSTQHATTAFCFAPVAAHLRR